MGVRKAMLAGSWYPGTASACRRQIEQFLGEAETDAADGGVPVGGIVPHAGWYYSGSIACRVIRHLALGERPDVIVVFGMHLHPKSPCYITPRGEWETPLGNLAVAEGLADELLREFDFNVETPERSVQDNTIELQLPFIRYFFDRVQILPIGAPPTDRSLAVAKATVSAANRLGLHLMVIGSTDLTHYGTHYGFAPQGTGPRAADWARNENDSRVIQAMTAMDPERVIQEALAHQNACCSGAAAAAIAAAGDLGATAARQIAYGSSHEKNPGDSFVGYVGIVFERPRT